MAGQQDAAPFDPIMGATGDERGESFGQPTAGKARLLERLPNREQPRAHMPEPDGARVFEIEIDESLVMRPTSRNVGPPWYCRRQPRIPSPN